MTAGRAGATAAVECGAIHIARLEQMRCAPGDVRIHLTKGREVIKNPERSAVRRCDEISFLDREIMHWNDRKILPQRLPVSAVIEAHPHASLSSRVKQSFANRIFSYDADKLGRRNSIDEQLPCRAVIACPIDVRPH